MHDVLEREVERQVGEITGLYQIIAHQEREIRQLQDALVIAEGQRDQLRADALGPTATDVLFPGAA
jgi:hypothetical protein